MDDFYDNSISVMDSEGNTIQEESKEEVKEAPKEEVKDAVKEKENNAKVDNTEEKDNKDDVINKIKKQRKSRASKRINNLVARLKSKEEEIIRLQEELNRLKNTPKKKVEVDIQEPDIDNFDTYDEYLEALEKYEQKLNEKKEEVKEEIKQEEPNNNYSKKVYLEKVHELAKDGMETYPDFEERVIKNEKLPLPDSVLKEIVDLPDGADIVYYLSYDVEKAKELTKLTPQALKQEIINISNLLEQAQEEAKKQEKKVSEAPEPINPVKGETQVNALESDDFHTFEKAYQELVNQYSDW